MPSSRKSALLALAAALGVTHAVAQKPEVKGKESKESKKPAGEKTGKLDPNAEEPLQLPIPKGQPQKGVKVPLYGANGKLKMNFEIGIGTYVDEEHVKLQKLRVETYRDDGSRELDMDLPDAVYNKKTKTISSDTKVVIKRDDFEVTGNTMAFNIETREGILGGGVKMVIYDLPDTAGAKSTQPTVEFDTPVPPPVAPTEQKSPK